MPKKLAVIGQGYVGLPLAVRAAEVGYQVVGYDVDEARISQLSGGRSYVEDVSDERLATVLDSARYSPSDEETTLGNFDIAVVTVPTPLMDGAPDLSYIEAAARTLAKYLRPGALVCLESTTYPGTTEDVFGPILETHSRLKPGKDFDLGYSPERIDPGNPTWQFHNTPKIVSGVNQDSLTAMEEFYADLVSDVVAVKGTREAELAKLLENTYRHVNIALVNELAIYAHELGVDVWSSIQAASTKPFGFMPFTPGPGVGGHCLPVDPAYLGWRVKRETGHPFRFVELANDINDQMPTYVVERAMLLLNKRQRSLSGASVLVLGFTYKPNSSDVRESPSEVVIQRLLKLGALVTVIDPHLRDSSALPSGVSRRDLTEVLDGHWDLAIHLTHHDEFLDTDWSTCADAVLDTRGRFTPSAVVELL